MPTIEETDSGVDSSPPSDGFTSDGSDGTSNGITDPVDPVGGDTCCDLGGGATLDGGTYVPLDGGTGGSDGGGSGAGCLRWVAVEIICDAVGENCVAKSIYVPAECTVGTQATNTFEECPECPTPTDGGVGILIPKVLGGGGTEEVDCNIIKDSISAAFPNVPDSEIEILVNQINEKGKDFGIDSKEKLQHFISQACHESGKFNNLSISENLNYTTTSRIIAVWPKRFSSTDTTKLNPANFVNNPQKLANEVYKNRNGNTNVDDGWNFRGRGIFQLTGRSNYQSFENFYNSKYDPDIIANPDLLSTDKNLSVISALWFYQKKVLEKLTVDDKTTVEKVTKK